MRNDIGELYKLKFINLNINFKLLVLIIKNRDHNLQVDHHKTYIGTWLILFLNL